MKKISLIVVSSLFSLGVIAQTAPAVSHKMTTSQPAKTTTTAETAKPATKNNLKKSTTGKRVSHQLNTPKNAAKSAPAQAAPAEQLKK